MNTEVITMLEKSPHPAKWTIAFFICVLGGIFLHVTCFIVLGLLVGLYFGNYQGRQAVLTAWQRDLQIQYEQKYGPPPTRELLVELDEEGQQ